MKNKWNIGVAVIAVIGLLVICTGCPFSPNVSSIQEAFCAEYPEVCQFVDFDTD